MNILLDNPIKLFFLCVSLLFSILLFSVALLLPYGQVPYLDGNPGIIDHSETIETIDGPWDLFYYFGDIWCHQMHDRSFVMNGNQLPVCIRCFGIFLGIPIGFFISYLVKIPVTQTLHRKIISVLLFGGVPIVIDGGFQLLGIWESTPFSRIFTGLLGGAAAGLLLAILLDVIMISLKTDR
jgi:uncharacterized membrane protein